MAGRETPAPAGYLGNYGVIDLTPPSVPAAATGGVDAAELATRARTPGHADKEKSARSIVFKTPVPLWKARDIILDAVTNGSSEFFQTRSAVSSRDQRKRRTVETDPTIDNDRADGGRDRDASGASGAAQGGGVAEGRGSGGDVERVFSIRLEVRVSVTLSHLVGELLWGHRDRIAKACWCDLRFEAIVSLSAHVPVPPLGPVPNVVLALITSCTSSASNTGNAPFELPLPVKGPQQLAQTSKRGFRDRHIVRG